jgi:photosystem II stability/assembly factor-like uncharacterized protein
VKRTAILLVSSALLLASCAAVLMLPSSAATSGAASAALPYVGWTCGMASDGSALIMQSVDGGGSWTRQQTSNLPQVELNCIAAIDAQNCWAVGESDGVYGTIVRTTDGGNTWQRQGSPSEIPNVGLLKICALGRNTAWVVGESQGTILFTSDGGRTWASKTTAEVPDVQLQGVDALDALNVWVTGAGAPGKNVPTLLRTSDGGKTWVDKAPAASDTEHMLAISARDGSHAWGVGGGSIAFGTSDNGGTWRQVMTQRTSIQDLNDVATPAPGIVWIAADYGSILRSDDDGATWRQQTSGSISGYWLMSMDALDENTAWVAGPTSSFPMGGVVCRTTDGGKSWQTQLEVTNDMLMYVSFVKPFVRYLAEGSNAWGFSTYITVENSNDQAVHAEVTYQTNSGQVAGGTFTLAPGSQLTINPANVVEDCDFSTKVQCTEGLPVAVDRTMSWANESHNSISARSPSTTWYLPEGCTDYGFETWLLIQNPMGTDASVQVTYGLEGGGPKTVTKTVPAFTRQTFNAADDIGAANTSMEVTSSVPVIAERSMYRDDRIEGDVSIGATAPGSDFYLAEGSTAWGFTTWLLIQNPNGRDATVSVTYLTPDGPVTQAPFTVPAQGRGTIRVNDVPGMSDTDCSIHVQGSLPIAAERAMYWNNGEKDACHQHVGTASPHGTWYLPAGQTSQGRETYTLVANPNASDIRVTISYLTDTGQGGVTFTDTVKANSRKTYDMAAWIPDGRASVVVSCPSPVVVERSMYWGGRGFGTDTLGDYSD